MLDTIPTNSREEKHAADNDNSPRASASHKIRTVIYLPADLHAELKERSEYTGAPLAELARRAVSYWLGKRISA